MPVTPARFRSLTRLSAIAATWTFDRPEVTTIKSPIEDLPVISMVTLSSAFMSSRRARTMRNVSLALGRLGALERLETDTGERRVARETACVARGFYPFASLH